MPSVSLRQLVVGMDQLRRVVDEEDAEEPLVARLVEQRQSRSVWWLPTRPVAMNGAEATAEETPISATCPCGA